MQVPLELSYREVKRTESTDTLIQEQVAKLERVCNYITSCRVVVEQPQKHMNSGNPFRVRIDLTVPPGHELIAKHEAGQGDMHADITSVIRDVFGDMRRQLQELVEKQRRDVKVHEDPSQTALVSRVFKDDGYGFIESLSGTEFYFHKNSVLHEDFDRIEIGTMVRFFPEMGEKGPQASTIQILDKPGARRSKTEEHDDLPE